MEGVDGKKWAERVREKEDRSGSIRLGEWFDMEERGRKL